MKKIALLSLLLLTAHAQPQAKAKAKIYVECTCDDPVATLYATALRDAIANSPRYVEAEASESPGKDGKGSDPNWVLSIVSIDDSTSVADVSTALSVVMKVGDNFFLTHWIQVCGRDKVAYCASQTLANFDSKIHH